MAKPKERKPDDLSEGRTLFMRNVSFDTESEDLQEILAEFGPLNYAIICFDQNTGHSKGTAFAKFATKESADSCLQAAASNDRRLFIDGRQLNVTLAVPRNEITTKAGDKTRERDKRNLYLAKEGLIYADSPAADGVSQSDLEKRLNMEQNKRKLLQDITRFVSRNRLCIHNLPPTLDDQKLKSIFAGAVPKEAKILEARIMKNKSASGEFTKSKGFGFVEFAEHHHALMALRKLNNNPETFTPQSRPIVEFSVESKVALNKRKRTKFKNNKTTNPSSGKSNQPNDDDEEEDQPSFSGVKAKPLREDEKVEAPKLNRKIHENKKRLTERKKKLKKEEKAKKVQQEHEKQRALKSATKKQTKILQSSKKEGKSDLAKYEAKHLAKARNEIAPSKAARSGSSLVAKRAAAQKTKWFVTDMKE